MANLSSWFYGEKKTFYVCHITKNVPVLQIAVLYSIEAL